MQPSPPFGGDADSAAAASGNRTARLHLARMRRRQRRKRARKVTITACALLGLLLVLVAGFTLTCYLTSPARRVPPLEEVLAMDDGEAAEALSRFTEAHITEAWGEPISAYEHDYEIFGPCRYLLFKSPESLDHVELFIPLSGSTVAYAEVWQVFRAYPVHIGRGGEWATVTPCPWEAETAYGDLIAINLATSRPAVLDSLDPHMPVIIYYKGTPALVEGQPIPRISTVEEMHFYDNSLEPLEPDEDP